MNSLIVDYTCRSRGRGACKYHSSGLGAGNGCDHCIKGYCYNHEARNDALNGEIALNNEIINYNKTKNLLAKGERITTLSVSQGTQPTKERYRNGAN